MFLKRHNRLIAFKSLTSASHSCGLLMVRKKSLSFVTWATDIATWQIIMIPKFKWPQESLSIIYFLKWRGRGMWCDVRSFDRTSTECLSAHLYVIKSSYNKSGPGLQGPQLYELKMDWSSNSFDTVWILNCRLYRQSDSLASWRHVMPNRY